MISKDIVKKERFCEFFGALLGDGCISQFVSKGRLYKTIRLEGNKINDYFYLNRIIKPIIFELFNKKVNVKPRKDNNSIHIYFKSKEIFDFLITLGFPVGVKNNLKIPNIFLGLRWQKLKHLILGILDTDGCLHFTKNNKNKNWYPSIEIRSSSEILLFQLYKILKKQGFTPYIRETHLFLYGKQNIEKWYNEIGFNNIRHLSKFIFWKEYGFCPIEKELDLKERLQIVGPICVGPVSV